MLLSLLAARCEPVGPGPTGSAGRGDRRRLASLLLAATTLVAATGCSASDQQAGAVLPVGPTVSKTLVTLDLEAIEQCKALAAAVVPLWDSLGNLTGEEANRLDGAVVTEIGTYLDGIERRRKALGCAEEQWKLDTCAALEGTTNAIAERFSATSC